MGRIRFGVWAAMVWILVPLAGAQSYTVTDLGVLAGGDETIPAAINNHGWVAGHAYTNGEGLAINDQGVVVGYSGSYELSSAFVWTQNDEIRSLGAGESVASGINDAGEIVGAYGAVDIAFVWTPVQHLQNLNNLIPPNSGWVLGWAVAINRSGQITSLGIIGDQFHGCSFDSHELARVGSIVQSSIGRALCRVPND